MKLSIAGRPKNQNVKIVNFNFFVYFSKIKRIIYKIGLFEKSIENWTGGVGLVFRLKLMDFLTEGIFFTFCVLKIF